MCWACKDTENVNKKIKNKKRTGFLDRSLSSSFGSETIRSWDHERGFREIRSNGGSASTRLCIGPYMVAGRICLYIGRARKRGRIRNEEAGTHIYSSRIRFTKFFFFSFFFHSFRMPVWAFEAFVCAHTSLVCLTACNGKKRERDLDCSQQHDGARPDKIILFLRGRLWHISQMYCQIYC